MGVLDTHVRELESGERLVMEVKHRREIDRVELQTAEAHSSSDGLGLTDLSLGIHTEIPSPRKRKLCKQRLLFHVTIVYNLLLYYALSYPKQTVTYQVCHCPRRLLNVRGEQSVYCDR